MRLRHIHSIIKQFRLLLWRILDAIDHKLGPGPGDHRLYPTFKTKFYINFALMNCGTFQAIFISLVNATGLKP